MHDKNKRRSKLNSVHHKQKAPLTERSILTQKYNLSMDVKYRDHLDE